MIESCSAKRMLISIVFLGGLTLLVLIIESHWTDNNTHLVATISTNQTSNCWLKESFRIIEQCHPCTDFEITSQSNPACKETRYKEAVECETSGKVYRSCAKVSWIEETKFWKFESCMFGLAVVSTAVAYFRQAVLNRRVMLRIQKQLYNYA